MSEMVIISHADLFTAVRDLFEACGLTRDDADRGAYVFVTAELRGVSSHGIQLMFGNLERLAGGAIDPHARPEVVTRTDSIAIIDAHRALGPVAGCLAAETAIEMARENALGYCLVRNSNHYGSAGVFALMPVREGFVAISTSICGPTMAIHGGIERVIGTNPIAIAAPPPPGYDHPIMLDMATSTAAIGKIGVLKDRGEQPPRAWFADKDITDEPRVLAPAGGAKGSGLAVMLEILNGVLTGGAVLSRMRPDNFRQDSDNASHSIVVIDYERFMTRSDYNQTMLNLIAELKSARCESGVNEILLPGERAGRETRKRMEHGIPLPRSIAQRLDDEAGRLGTSLPWGDVRRLKTP
jgi:L-2-hydroxycarboxylate dehydrogenase (NAD+)